MKKLIYLLTGLLFSISSMAQDDSVMIKKITDEVLTNGKAYEYLRVLCKQVGPRLSGSPQAAKAVEVTKKMMEDLGADKVWLQECMVPHWVRGKKEEAKIIYAGGKTYPLDVTALGNSLGSGDKGVTANVIEVKDFDELKTLGEKVIKGNIVFYNHPFVSTFVNTFQAYGEAGKYRFAGASQAAKYGAIGCIVRSMASNVNDFPHTGAMAYNDSFPKIPAVAISTLDAEYLSKALKTRIMKQVYLRTNSQMLDSVKSYNVIGELKGTEFPDEIITVGGHLDSWDLAEGAHDDGAGCVQSIEVLRVLKALGYKPKRTIRAVMFMNEENGGKGGDKYYEEAKAKGEKHLFAMESDEGGFTPRGFGVSGSKEVVEKVKGWMPLFHPYGLYEMHEGGGGADIGDLKQLGTVLSNIYPDSQRYFDVHHAATDKLEAVSERELKLSAAMMAAFIYLVDKYGL
ncbi:MAG: M20/M25/M40 family metallo-hydrolase [Sphingobacteriales bacterium]|nr:M20/M25/M40 family metallo-hydrolase [Sphingobacteriales bacterium]